MNNLQSKSNEVFGLIKGGDPVKLLDFFQSLQYQQRVELLDTPNILHHGQLPLTYSLNRPASQIIILLLLKWGANYECFGGLATRENPPALILAARNGLIPIFRALLMIGANPNCTDFEGFTVLHWAVRRGDALLVRTILRIRAFSLVNSDRNKERISPLKAALDTNNPAVLSELLNSQAVKMNKLELNYLDTPSQRYLYDIAAEGRNALACALLERAYIRNNCNDSQDSETLLLTKYHKNHYYRLEIIQERQLRSKAILFFKADPRAPWITTDNQIYSNLVEFEEQRFKGKTGDWIDESWQVFTRPGSESSWTYSTEYNATGDKYLCASFTGDQLDETSNNCYFDNSRCRYWYRLRRLSH